MRPASITYIHRSRRDKKTIFWGILSWHSVTIESADLQFPTPDDFYVGTFEEIQIAIDKEILRCLATTCLFQAGIQASPELAASGWTAGIEALHLLAEKIKGHLDDPALFSYQSDLWVAARNREFFATVLASLGEVLSLPSFSALALWCQKEVVTRWMTLIQVIECNQQALQRGKQPRTYPIKLLQHLALLEQELVVPLATILGKEGHIALPSVLTEFVASHKTRII